MMVHITLTFTLLYLNVKHCRLCFLLLDVPLISSYWFSCLDRNKWSSSTVASMWRCFKACFLRPVVSRLRTAQQLHTGLYWRKLVTAWGGESSKRVCGESWCIKCFFSRWEMSVALGVDLKISSILIGSLGYAWTRGRRRVVLPLLANLFAFSSPPKHSFGRLWITCTHPCLNCSNMLEVDQTERLSQGTADRASPRGLLGIRRENRERTKACRDC